jgi:serine/threonine protein kinase
MRDASEALTDGVVSRDQQGLGHIHKRGYMFRDLKPENLLLDTSGYLKITDFGFAKSLDKGKSFTMCGTPDYLVRTPSLRLAVRRSVTGWEKMEIHSVSSLDGSPQLSHPQ